MKALEAVLQGLIGICSLFILEFNFVILTLGTFIHQLTDKKGYQAVERILFVADIVMAQNLFKPINNLIIWRKIHQIFFLTWLYANIVCLRIVSEDNIST